MSKPINLSDDVLLDYLDGHLSNEEMLTVETACKQQPWADRLKELTKLHQSLSFTLSEDHLMATPINFSESVMASINKTAIVPDAIMTRRGFILLITMILMVLGGAFFISNSQLKLSLPNSYTSNQLTELIQLDALPSSLNIGGFMNALMFALVICSLILLDRLVLKPYFKKRRAI